MLHKFRIMIELRSGVFPAHMDLSSSEERPHEYSDKKRYHNLTKRHETSSDIRISRAFHQVLLVDNMHQGVG